MAKMVMNNKKYKAIVFDLDGTLADTSPGIYNCYRHTFEQMNLPMCNDLGDALGAPLASVFSDRLGFDAEKTKEAVTLFRARYADTGIREALLYQGIESLLGVLKQRGYHLGVATLKPDSFAKQMLSEMDVSNQFDFIMGNNGEGTRSKAMILHKCMHHFNVDPSQTLLIGDSDYDAKGAREACADFAAVLYGYGFKAAQDVAKWQPVFVANAPVDFVSYL